MRFQLSLEGRQPALCAGGSSSPTTGLQYIWVFIGVRSSHVVSVGKYWQLEGTGQSTHNHVCEVSRLHALYVENNLLVLKPCISTTRPNMGLILWFPQVGLFAHFVANPFK